MKLLFIGDVNGRSGRDALQTHLPQLRQKLDPDFIVVNGDNAAHGRGITQKICEELFALHVDCITSGDHVWDQREILSYIAREDRFIRPKNYKPGTPGSGSLALQKNGYTLQVLHLQGRTFMKGIDDPFDMAERFCDKHKIGSNHFIFVDFHAEATSEKMALGHYLDGKISALVGSHTHVPTADTFCLSGGTGYQTDAGMTGDFDSVIGAQKENAIDRFVKQMPRTLNPAEGVATLCGTFILCHDDTGLCQEIHPIRLGGILPPSTPYL